MLRTSAAAKSPGGAAPRSPSSAWTRRFIRRLRLPIRRCDSRMSRAAPLPASHPARSSITRARRAERDQYLFWDDLPDDDGARDLRASSSPCSLPGDFNHDSIVDTADYTIWQDTLSQTGSGLMADSDGNMSLTRHTMLEEILWRLDSQLSAASRAIQNPRRSRCNSGSFRFPYSPRRMLFALVTGPMTIRYPLCHNGSAVRHGLCLECTSMQCHPKAYRSLSHYRFCAGQPRPRPNFAASARAFPKLAPTVSLRNRPTH